MARTFTASFPIETSREIADLSDVIKKWVVKKTGVKRSKLEGLQQDEFKYNSDDVDVSSARALIDNSDNLAVRVEEKDERGILTTEVSGRKNGKDFKVAVKENFDTSRLGETYDPEKPIIIDSLLSRLGGGSDGKDLKVQDSPILIFTEKDIEIAKRIIANISQNALPVVYLTYIDHGKLPVDLEELPRQLAGMAHVLVEPYSGISLEKELQDRQILRGEVGIYWPTGTVQRISAKRSVAKILYDTIREAGLHLSLDKVLTYDGIRSYQLDINRDRKIADFQKSIADLQSRVTDLQSKQGMSQEEQERAIKEVRDQAFKAIEEQAIELAIGDIDKLKAGHEREKRELKDKYNHLERQAEEAKAKLAEVYSGDSIVLPNVPQLYQRELRDIVIDALQNYLPNTPEDSRRKQLIQSLLDNNEHSGELERIKTELKRIFNDSPDMKGRTIRELKALGFEVDTSGKHAKIYVPGNEDLFYVVAKTPSDHRSGLNTVLDIKKKLL